MTSLRRGQTRVMWRVRASDTEGETSNGSPTQLPARGLHLDPACSQPPEMGGPALGRCGPRRPERGWPGYAPAASCRQLVVRKPADGQHDDGRGCIGYSVAGGAAEMPRALVDDIDDLMAGFSAAETRALARSLIVRRTGDHRSANVGLEHAMRTRGGASISTRRACPCPAADSADVSRSERCRTRGSDPGRRGVATECGCVPPA